MDRFKSLVNQVSREIDDGLDAVRREITESSPPSSYHDPTKGLGPDALDRPGNIYDEFGSRIETPDEHVRVLGGYIRRMPTIESLGSREMGSMASSTHRDVFLGSVQTNSHPPTRTNTLGGSVPSRSNSMTSSTVHSPVSAPGGAETVGVNASSHYVAGVPRVESPPPDSRSVQSPSPVVFVNSVKEPVYTPDSTTF